MSRAPSSRSLWLGLALLYGLFLFWYGGCSEPLSEAEVNTLLAQVEANAEGEADPELLSSLRRAVAGDDGREFFMVNLIRHREQAEYPAGDDDSDDVAAAERRYARGIFPRLLKRAAIPILVSEPSGLFLQPEGADRWDQVAIVRYRSRRDFLEMVAEPGMRELGQHKWASVEKTQVFPARPIFTVASVRSAVLLGLLLLGGLITLLRRATRG